MMRKTYTIQKMAGVPCLTIRGKFLEKEFGIGVGEKLQLIEENDMLILRKLPKEQAEEKTLCGKCKKNPKQ